MLNRRDFMKTLGAAGSILGLGQSAFAESTTYNMKTKHLIWIMNGNGSRKKEWYEDPKLSPNYARLVKEGFVYEEDHNETTSLHGRSWTETLTGNRIQTVIPMYPTPTHYVRKVHGGPASNYWFVNGVSYYRQWRYNQKYYTSHPEYGAETRPVSLTATHIYWPDQKRTPQQIVEQEFPDMDLTPAETRRLEEFIDATHKMKLWEFNLKYPPIPRDPFIGDALGLALLPILLKEFKPKVMIYQQVGHDTGHGNGGYLRQQTGFFEYEKVCKTTDEQLGRLIDFIKNDQYFSQNTAIVIRPEFGRDDEINMYGEVNHSDGYYQCHRSASIWWGPDFKVGKSNLLVNRMDTTPTIAQVFNAPAPYCEGKVRNHLFKEHVGKLPEYQVWTPNDYAS